MIVTETVQIDEQDFVHTYSDIKKMIQKVGTDEIYDDAYDPVAFAEERKYVETDIDIPEPPAQV